MQKIEIISFKIVFKLTRFQSKNKSTVYSLHKTFSKKFGTLYEAPKPNNESL